MVDLLFSAPTEHYCLAFCAVINDLMSHKRYGKAKLLPANCGVNVIGLLRLLSSDTSHLLNRVPGSNSSFLPLELGACLCSRVDWAQVTSSGQAECL
jgi:hypothetical protein